MNSAQARTQAAREVRLAHDHERREAHEQILDERVLTRERPSFEGCQFLAYASTMSANGKQGTVLTLMIPEESLMEALPMHWSFGIPLSIDVQVFKPYADSEPDGE